MPYKKVFAVVICLLLLPIEFRGAITFAAAKKDRIVALPPNTVLNEFGTLVLDEEAGLGFVSSTVSGALICLSVTSGRVLSSASFGEMAGTPSLILVGGRRLLALPTVDAAQLASVTIIHATNAVQLERVSRIELPPTARIQPDTRALLTRDGRFGVIAVSLENPALFSFNVETGEIISHLHLYGQPSGLVMHENDSNRMVVVTNPKANNILLCTLDPQGQLTAVGDFKPADAQLGAANDPVFSADGSKIYLAASKGDRLFVIDAKSGRQEGSIVVSCPQRITVARDPQGREILGVTRLLHPVTNKPGGVTILAVNAGEVTMKAEFKPPGDVIFSPANNVAFSSDGSFAFIGSANGIIFSFNPMTGALVNHLLVGDELRHIAFSPNDRSVIITRSTLIEEDIAIIGVDRLCEKREDHPLPQVNPEIRQVTNQGLYVHLLIEGSNFRKGSIVEFVKAGAVVMKQSPNLLTETYLTVSVPAKKLENLGPFTVRVVTGTKAMTSLTSVDLQTTNVRMNSVAEASRAKSSLPPGGEETSTSDERTTVIPLSINLGSATGVKGFNLSQPFRIVVDIMGVHTPLANRTIKKNSLLIERVRTGIPKPGVLRIVFDAKTKVSYELTRKGNSVIISIWDADLTRIERFIIT